MLPARYTLHLHLQLQLQLPRRQLQRPRHATPCIAHTIGPLCNLLKSTTSRRAPTTTSRPTMRATSRLTPRPTPAQTTARPGLRHRVRSLLGFSCSCAPRASHSVFALISLESNDSMKLRAVFYRYSFRICIHLQLFQSATTVEAMSVSLSVCTNVEISETIGAGTTKICDNTLAYCSVSIEPLSAIKSIKI